METPNADWQRTWDINVMAHVWARASTRCR